MAKYEYIFVVLTYRNTEDIVDFISSVEKNLSGFKIIIVNSFYDQKTKNILQKIAKDHDCDFLNIENRGYGYGNNQGIQFAVKNYIFDFLIVSNPDIEIQNFPEETLRNYGKYLIGPQIVTGKGKSQNPYWVFENRWCEFLIYLGYKRRSRLALYSGIAINKLIRETWLLYNKVFKRTAFHAYALHGSFVIFPSNVISKLGSTVYDEAIFLFAEEADLAHRLHGLKIESVVIRELLVHHKEDSSMSIAKIDEASEARKSVIYYYEKYHDRG